MKTVSLKDIVDVLPSSYGDELGTHAEVCGVVKVSNVDPVGKFHREFELRSFKSKEIADLLVRENELLVVKSSGSKANVLSGKTAFCDKSLSGKIVASNFLLRLRPREDKVNPRYLWFFLNSPQSKSFVQTIVGTTTYPNLKWNLYSKHPIPLPPLEEQRRIAEVLDRADALRQKRRLALQNLDTLRQCVFLEIFGDPTTNPKGWKEESFGDLVVDTQIGLVRSSKEFGANFRFPYVRMDSITRSGEFFAEKVQYTDASDLEAEAFALKRGDFLFNTRNSKELVGKVCIFPGPDGWLYNNNILRARFRGGIEASVVAHQFRFERVRLELEKRKSGTTNVFAVYWKSLKSLPILVPPADLQRTFKKIDEQIEQQKRAHQRHLVKADELFSSLQFGAFSGGRDAR
jgi:type I restriction enzyme, S subunit